MEIYLGLTRVKNGKLNINGFAENVTSVDLLVFKNKGKEIFATVKKSAVLSDRYNFEISVGADKAEIEFPAEISFRKFSTLSRERKAVLSSGYKLWYNGSRLFVKKASASDKLSVKFSLGLHYLKTHQKVFLNRISVRDTKEKIRLYCDRENLIDNGYYQFLHDVKMNDGIKRYYLTSADIREKYFEPDERENVILFKSAEHKKIFFACDKIISSFNSMSIYSPFGSDPTSFYYDLIH